LFSISDFEKQDVIQLNSLALKVDPYIAYFTPCAIPNCPYANDATIVSANGNSLRDSEFVKVLNIAKLNLPFTITFETKLLDAKGKSIDFSQRYWVKIY